MQKILIKSLLVAISVSALGTLLVNQLDLIKKPACDFTVNTNTSYSQGVPCSVSGGLTQNNKLAILALLIFVTTFIVTFFYIKLSKKRR